jgi:hypothetical protein
LQSPPCQSAPCWRPRRRRGRTIPGTAITGRGPPTRSHSPFDDYVSSPWKTYLSGAAGDWGQKGTFTDIYGSFTANSPVTPIVNPNQGADRKCRPISGQVKVCDSTYGNNGWLGIAQVWVSGSHTTQGTVKLNDTYYASSFYNTPVWRADVVCQETGHAIGLDHQDTSGANFHTSPTPPTRSTSTPTATTTTS